MPHLRVLYVAHKHAYGDPARGPAYEEMNFPPVLRALGCEVTPFDMCVVRAEAGTAESNRRLLALAERTRPDLLFAVPFTDEVYPQTLAAIDRHLCPVVCWFCDDHWRFPQFTRFFAPHVTLSVTTCREALAWYARRGARVVLSQWAANTETFRPAAEPAAPAYEVSFVGAAYGRRPAWIKHLVQAGVKTSCFGHGWPAGPISEAAMVDVYRASRVNLNFATGGTAFTGLWPRRTKQIKARLFEVTACGGFLLTEEVEGLEEYFQPRKEIETFASAEELLDKCRYYLEHEPERRAIASAGCARTHREHTYRQRFGEIFAALEALDRRPAKTGANADVELPQVVAPHFERSFSWRAMRALLRPLVLFPCRLVWGRERGPRAARRLLTELAWRLLGAAAYGPWAPQRVVYPKG